MKKYIDLHAHTTASDGTIEPVSLVYHAYEKNLAAIAITDHDTVSGIKDAVNEGQKLNIEVIPGIEISADYKKEMHILGYYLDIEAPELYNTLERLKQYRIQRNPLIIKKLNRLGLNISYDEVKQEAGNGLVGRPHIAKIMIEKGYVNSIDEAFSKYLGFGKAAYVKREKLSPQEGIRLIKNSGGIAVLAHPHYISKDYEEIEILINRLKKYGLDGIEAYYTDYSLEMQKKYLHIAKKFNLLITGGSDFHGDNKPNIKLGEGFGNLKVPYSILQKIKDTRK